MNDAAINELILMLQKQTFIYYMDDDAFYGRGYGITELVIIMISVDQQKPIELRISRNGDKGQLLVTVNYYDDLSAVYKFSNDSGTFFYDWLLEQ